MHIPAAGVEYVRQQGSNRKRVLKEVLLHADISIMDGPGGELRKILWCSKKVLRLDLRAAQRPDGEAHVAVVGPALVLDIGASERTA